MTPAQAIKATASEVLRWTAHKKSNRAPVTIEVCKSYVERVVDGLSLGNPLCPLERKTRAAYMRNLGCGE